MIEQEGGTIVETSWKGKDKTYSDLPYREEAVERRRKNGLKGVVFQGGNERCPSLIEAVKMLIFATLYMNIFHFVFHIVIDILLLLIYIKKRTYFLLVSSYMIYSVSLSLPAHYTF